MSNFQFAFLGHQHNYLARVVTINREGWAQEDAVTEDFGLPRAFANNLKRDQYLRRFMTNIRGHDFLSHAGKWTDSEKGYAGHNPTAKTSVLESSLLESLMQENQENGKDELNMIASYGPQPGSMFVNAFALKQYRWRNLPTELEGHIQRALSVKGYGEGKGVIHDVAMNAAGGWVILFDEGKRFEFGGPPGALPPKLEQALVDARKDKDPKRSAIERIYLNHQNKDEYLVLFQNGWTMACLHRDFEAKLNTLLIIWWKKKRLRDGKLDFDHNQFSCDKNIHSNLNALYYSRRGLFFLSRGDPEMAFRYMQEAIHQHWNSSIMRNNYALSIIALRKQRQAQELDYDLDDMDMYRPPPRPDYHKDKDTLFRDAFLWMRDQRDINVPALELRLAEIQRPFSRQGGRSNDNGMVNEWSFEMATAHEGPIEMESPRREYSVPPSPLVAELEDAQWSPRTSIARVDTTMSEMSSSTGREMPAPDVTPDENGKSENPNAGKQSRSRTIMGRFGRDRTRVK